MLPSSAVALKPATAIIELHNQAPLHHESLPLVVQVATTDMILRAWQEFHDLKLKLLDTNDFAEIRGERFARKSAYRKLALAFGISTEVVREDRIDFKDSTAYLFTVKAISPNGRFMVASGSCHTDERRFTKPSDCRATAETRAVNRAIANLLGWSQVSAEEVIGGEKEDPAPTKVPTAVYSKDDPSDFLPPKIQTYDMTPRQRALLINLINQKVIDSDERENALSAIESYSKEDASHVIGDYLELQPA